ncbi:hypothetical protein CEXT_53651 [Caerostris extrusa]|uniref:Uncharacterized protein n=1 Tax=Caerostris extrusa TaxID=172846 RepID=A0AAV4XE91_CAEEX|nr:hypothetical protein CEXT_53651 [Caerostris extrusa]
MCHSRGFLFSRASDSWRRCGETKKPIPSGDVRQHVPLLPFPPWPDPPTSPLNILLHLTSYSLLSPHVIKNRIDFYDFIVYIYLGEDLFLNRSVGLFYPLFVAVAVYFIQSLSLVHGTYFYKEL